MDTLAQTHFNYEDYLNITTMQGRIYSVVEFWATLMIPLY